MGWPVVTVASGGIPVTTATNGYGTPITEAANGLGIAVTFVASGGLPVVGGGGVLPGTLSAAKGTFSLTGNAANLIKTVAGAYIIAADTGTFVLTGDPMTPLVFYYMGAAQGTFTSTGQSAGMLKASLVTAAAGSFAMTGVAATLTKATPSTYTGPGDRASGWSIWGGLRAFSAAYAAPGTNPAIDLVDQAGANPYTAKILSSGDLDMAGIAAWVTANSVTTAKVTKLYDQTGGGNHMVQATLANMPDFLLNQVGTKPGLMFHTATSTALVSGSAITTLVQPYSVSLVGKTPGVSGGVTFKIFTSVGSFNAIFSGNSTNTWEAYNGPNPAFPATDGAAHGVVVLFNGASSTAYCDTTLTNLTTLGTGSGSGSVGVGAGPAANFNLEGNVFEVGYNSTNLTSIQATLVADQKTYWGF